MRNLSTAEIAFVAGGFDEAAYNAGVETGTASGTTLVKGGKVIAAVVAVALFVITR